MLSLKAQPTKIGIGNGSTQFMVTFTAVQRSLNVLAKRQRIDVVEQIETPDHVVIFPQGAPRLVLTGILLVLAERIADQAFLRLIARMLKAGVHTPGGVVYDELGSPQGSIVSPVIANAFLDHGA